MTKGINYYGSLADYKKSSSSDKYDPDMERAFREQIPKIKAAIKSATAQVHYGQADNLRGHLRSYERLLAKEVAKREMLGRTGGIAGAGRAVGGSSGSSSGRGIFGGGLPKGSK